MIHKMFKAVSDNLKVHFGGYCECLGVFRITDCKGALLPNVRVRYRIAEGDWTPCGRSTGGATSGLAAAMANFIQPSTLFYQIGEPVSWEFSKPGYTTRTITRYTAGKTFDETLNAIVLNASKAPATPMHDVDQDGIQLVAPHHPFGDAPGRARPTLAMRRDTRPATTASLETQHGNPPEYPGAW